MSSSDDKMKSYEPKLSREFSTISHVPDAEETTMSSDAQAFITQPVKRGRSLVRPERERIDENHRQYHYRQAASNTHQENIEPSRTGNVPLPRSLSRRGTTRSVGLRRGKSILGREEKGGEEFEYVYEEKKKTCWDNLPGPWMMWCYLLTFWIPTPLLNFFGKTQEKNFCISVSNLIM